ncbi:hypothetical protein ACF07S_03810 [Streptomyces sp. NPDC016640]|uniref:hypothetical protein n=1 Tax=Streptomyces sp. NPDC016640 TaxID=3364969 RepID=UPI0036F9935F
MEWIRSAPTGVRPVPIMLMRAWLTPSSSPAPFSGDDSVPLAPADAGTASGRGLRLVQEYAGSWGGWALGDGMLGRGAGELLWFDVGGRATLPLLRK